MKPFRLIWTRKDNKVHLGVSYEKRYKINIFGVENIITFYFWKKYKVIAWLSN